MSPWREVLHEYGVLCYLWKQRCGNLGASVESSGPRSHRAAKLSVQRQWMSAQATYSWWDLGVKYVHCFLEFGFQDRSANLSFLLREKPVPSVEGGEESGGKLRESYGLCSDSLSLHYSFPTVCVYRQQSNIV